MFDAECFIPPFCDFLQSVKLKRVREINELDVFKFETCHDFFVNIKFNSAKRFHLANCFNSNSRRVPWSGR